MWVRQMKNDGVIFSTEARTKFYVGPDDAFLSQDPQCGGEALPFPKVENYTITRGNGMKN